MIYKQIIDADVLSSFVTLPPNLKNKKVEMIIREIHEKKELPKISLREFNEMMDGSITQSLRGILSNTDKNITSDEIRTRRLEKYERAD